MKNKSSPEAIPAAASISAVTSWLPSDRGMPQEILLTAIREIGMMLADKGLGCLWTAQAHTAG